MTATVTAPRGAEDPADPLAVPSPDIAARVAALPGPPGGYRLESPRPFCAVIEPREPTERDVLAQHLLTPEHREAFFSLVDAVGLVVVRAVHVDPGPYRGVRGRSSRGRLSQGEYFHHDGCSGPTKPRIVEIRCPRQAVPRRVATAVAPFPETLYAMLRALPPALRDGRQLAPWCARLQADGGLPSEALDVVQGLATRAVRRSLGAPEARAYFREVDRGCDAYDAPWQMGESRFIANANPRRTMQHRRAYGATHDALGPSGQLLKRWPAEELG